MAAGATFLPMLLFLGFLRWATSAPPDVLVIVKKEVPSAGVQRVWSEVLGIPDPTGHGYKLRAGIRAVSSVNGHDETWIRVGFQPGTSASRRAQIVRAIRQSPMVDRVEEYVPSSE